MITGCSALCTPGDTLYMVPIPPFLSVQCFSVFIIYDMIIFIKYELLSF